jgi:hypothetical protein
MPRIDINFSDTQFDLIEPGVYLAVIDFVELKEKRDQSGTYLNWQFTLADEKYTGRKFWLITSLGEKSQWVIAKTLKALGVVAEGSDEGKSEIALEIDDDSNLLINPMLTGMECYLKIEYDTYNGNQRNRGSVVPAPSLPNSSIRF